MITRFKRIRIHSKVAQMAQNRRKIQCINLATFQIRAILSESVSPESHRTVESILEQVHKLSTLDKLLLYLKLPTGRPAEACDPLRQPLNPLGSRSGVRFMRFNFLYICLCRSEIQLTINWIRSHYEEDPQVRDWQCTFVI